MNCKIVKSKFYQRLYKCAQKIELKRLRKHEVYAAVTFKDD